MSSAIVIERESLAEDWVWGDNYLSITGTLTMYRIIVKSMEIMNNDDNKRSACIVSHITLSDEASGYHT